MSDLADAVASLERAVARLEQAADPARRVAADDGAAALAAATAARIDAALAKLGRLLEEEE
jgi:hypothetical protein